ncbi:hypothetical protein ACP0SL_09430, partial [Campylobacter coli]
MGIVWIFPLFFRTAKKSYAVWLQDESGKNRLDENKKVITKSIDLNDVLDIEYKGLEVIKLDIFGNPEKIGTLNGEFSPLQAKQFFSRYDLLKHCPNTNSGFSATLFGEKRKQKNTES